MRLVERLKDIFPGTNHVYVTGLSEATDLEIWQFAREHNYAIVSKDSDFNDLSILLGAPPKVIWLRIGNAFVQGCELTIRKYYQAIVDFLENPHTSLFSIDRS
jgi:predicted nuclease of predicted toxin-antitoxin system